MDKAASMSLGAHFSAPDWVEWERRFLADLGLEALSDAAWGPSGQIAANPISRDPVRVPTRASAGWKYVEDGVPDNEPYLDLEPWEGRGATLVQLAAVAWALLTDALEGRGDSGHYTDCALPLIIVPARQEFFHTIAFLRAVRVGAAEIARRFGNASEPRVRAVTSRKILMEQDIHTNLVRTTTAAIASVLGGADEISIRPHDLPSGESRTGRRLARNIAYLLRHEAHLDKVADPGAGSFYLERLTADLGSAAWTLFKDWESRGGLMTPAVLADLDAQCAAARAEAKERVATGKDVIVGVNRFQSTEVAE